LRAQPRRRWPPNSRACGSSPGPACQRHAAVHYLAINQHTNDSCVLFSRAVALSAQIVSQCDPTLSLTLTPRHPPCLHIHPDTDLPEQGIRCLHQTENTLISQMNFGYRISVSDGSHRQRRIFTIRRARMQSEWGLNPFIVFNFENWCLSHRLGHGYVTLQVKDLNSQLIRDTPGPLCTLSTNQPGTLKILNRGRV